VKRRILEWNCEPRGIKFCVVLELRHVPDFDRNSLGWCDSAERYCEDIWGVVLEEAGRLITAEVGYWLVLLFDDAMDESSADRAAERDDGRGFVYWWTYVW
jgi:hypothetical protein